VSTAARALRAGRLVGVPTETVYGLAADALNARACRRIFSAKGRPGTDPLIVHVAGMRQAEEVAMAGPAARTLMRAFWPGPLTLVLPKRDVVPAVVTAGRDSVAVRMPAHPLMRRAIAAAGRPLAAPSANAFGYVSPTCAEHVQQGLGKRIPFILDGGPCAIGVESTIVDMRDEARPRLLRPGKIGRTEIERVLGRRVPAAGRSVGKGRAGMLAPGMLARHYSPRTPLILRGKIPARELARAKADAAYVLFSATAAVRRRKNVVAWAERGDGPAAKASGVARMARRLFARLRELDQGQWSVIYAEMAPERGRDRGLAEAINDRLRRAAAR
jgi:L-threonylcarbamoyladenylate synthase